MSMIITEVTHVIQKTKDGYRVIERWGNAPNQQVDLFDHDLREESALHYLEVLAFAMESGCVVIEGLIAVQEPEGGWHVFDGNNKTHGRFETVGFALLMMIGPLHRMAHCLPPVPDCWVPLFIYVKGPAVGYSVAG